RCSVHSQSENWQNVTAGSGLSHHIRRRPDLGRLTGTPRFSRRRLMWVRNMQRARRRRFRPCLLGLEDRWLPSNSVPLSSTSWTALGPAPIVHGLTIGGLTGSGRIDAIAAHPTDANTVYVAAAGGGVWKTTNATAANPSWVPLTDG